MSEETRFDKVEVNRETALVNYKVELTTHDIADKMAELVGLDDEIKRIEAEKQVEIAKYASQIRTAKSKISLIVNQCRNGFEEVEEDCTFEYMWDLGFVYYYSLETGEKVHHREITKEERQMNAFDKKELERVASTKPASSNEIPRCHMNDMEFYPEEVDEAGEIIPAHYRCLTCNSTKPYKGE